jgi:hypothetical protein
MMYSKPLTAFGLVLAASTYLAAQPAKPPKEPAKLDIKVTPGTVEAGADATVTLKIVPIEGVKINRYPKIKLQVPAQAGLVGEARVEIGDAKPPPPEKMSTNYYKTVDPLELRLTLDDAATSGKHELDAKLTYFYCVSASGFCAPARLSIKIPVAVR